MSPGAGFHGHDLAPCNARRRQASHASTTLGTETAQLCVSAKLHLCYAIKAVVAQCGVTPYDMVTKQLQHVNHWIMGLKPCPYVQCVHAQLNLSAPKDLRSSLIQWINFVFLPEAVNRCAASPCK